VHIPLAEVIQRSPLVLPPNVPIKTAITAMSQHRTSCVLVMEQEHLVGIFTERDVVRTTAAGKTLESLQLGDLMTPQVITLIESDVDDIFAISRLLRRRRIRHLPILDRQGQLLGLVTPQSIRDALKPEHLLRFVRAGEIVTADVISADPTTSILRLVELMVEHHVSCVAIVEPSTSMPVGIVTERDIVQFQSLELDFARISAQEVMSTPLSTVKPQDSLSNVRDRMQQLRVRRLVVTGEEGELLGIVTQTHMLQLLDPMDMYSTIELLQQAIERKTLELQQEAVQRQELAIALADSQARYRSVVEDRQQAEEILRQQAERERLLTEMTQHIGRSLDLNEILQTMAVEVRQFLETDRVVVSRFIASGCVDVVAESVRSQIPPLLGLTLGSEHLATYWRNPASHHARTIEDVNTAELPQWYRDFLHSLNVRAKLVVPIWQEETLWGLLVAHHCMAPRRWQPMDLSLLEQLTAQLAIAIQQSQLYEQLQQVNRELERLAAVDDLTQVANRRRFDELLNREWLRLARSRSPLSLILGDVDDFKRYNETYGHQAGDACLAQVAQVLSGVARRATDLVARYGGEEFVIVLPNTDTTGAVQVARTIQAAIAALQIPHQTSEVAASVTMSLGIATMVPRIDRTPAELVGAADRALYRAKFQGRNRYAIGEWKA
jgi:diguanylate cyclase (GGDEF)-like protein